VTPWAAGTGGTRTLRRHRPDGLVFTWDLSKALARPPGFPGSYGRPLEGGGPGAGWSRRRGCCCRAPAGRLALLTSSPRTVARSVVAAMKPPRPP
jgi:hypothetical protein